MAGGKSGRQTPNMKTSKNQRSSLKKFNPSKHLRRLKLKARGIDPDRKFIPRFKRDTKLVLFGASSGNSRWHENFKLKPLGKSRHNRPETKDD